MLDHLSLLPLELLFRIAYFLKLNNLSSLAALAPASKYHHKVLNLELYRLPAAANPKFFLERVVKTRNLPALEFFTAALTPDTLFPKITDDSRTGHDLGLLNFAAYDGWEPGLKLLLSHAQYRCISPRYDFSNPLHYACLVSSNSACIRALLAIELSSIRYWLLGLGYRMTAHSFDSCDVSGKSKRRNAQSAENLAVLLEMHYLNNSGDPSGDHPDLSVRPILGRGIHDSISAYSIDSETARILEILIPRSEKFRATRIKEDLTKDRGNSIRYLLRCAAK